MALTSVLLAALAAATARAGEGVLLFSQRDLPYLITNAGSYRLVEPIAFFSNHTHAIEVRADNVTIDLNGFTLRGQGSLTGSGIFQTNEWRNLTVRNGMVVSWRGSERSGIEALGESARMDGITVLSNYNGITAGPRALVSGCMGTAQNRYAIRVGDGSRVEFCALWGNPLDRALYAGRGCAIEHCAVYDNYGGLHTEEAGSVAGCSVVSNSTYGLLVVGTGSLVSASAVVAGFDPGILAGPGSTVSRCLVYDVYGPGIEMGVGGTVEGCLVRDCRTGIVSRFAANIRNCLAYNNTRDGIAVSNNCRVAKPQLVERMGRDSRGWQGQPR